MCVCVGPTVWDLHLSVADQLAGQEGLGMSVLDECVLYHLHHAKSRLETRQSQQEVPDVSKGSCDSAVLL